MKTKKTKNPDGIVIYKASDGWRYREWENGKIIDASTEGYRNRFDCVRNLYRKRQATHILGTVLNLTFLTPHQRSMIVDCTPVYCPTITIQPTKRAAKEGAEK